MAIIIEQEKKKVSWLFLVGIILAFILVGLAVYYVFFATPELLEKVVLPKELQETKKISGVKIDISGIVSDPVFRSLRQYVTQESVGSIGRINPFVPF